ncbi:polyketide cyclase [Marmoricola endophyticus]|uniref:Polyketide cyclase n=1 Tax=Marmoricola endophyticus TaxID=2040280 RepID=A0A917BDV7_9ACTN|nr:nuclear transport factor 2 family protein [Marmoricola endophyticus]GGF38748.1 polyketide cyclase [Marmoricola endophyticus]
MSDHETTVRRHWACAEARDWRGYAATLATDVVYEAPQTRERIRGREALVAYMSAYPGDWHVPVATVVAGGSGAVSRVDALVGAEEMTGICFFEMGEDGLIRSMQDWWPQPYDLPPEREGSSERY